MAVLHSDVFAVVITNPDSCVTWMGIIIFALRSKYIVNLMRLLFCHDNFCRVQNVPAPGRVPSATLADVDGGAIGCSLSSSSSKDPTWHVTIQICTYNEGSVVTTTIDKACSQDFPIKQFSVQICDDSTDERTSKIINECVERWQAKGVDIERLTRENRVGYKAGNMRSHFDRIKGDFVCYLDSDHHVQPDFLRNVLPYFFDKNGNSIEKVAMVQTPNAYTNLTQNLLTECEAFGHDVFQMEEASRTSQDRKAFSFGSGAIWRKIVIAGVGGYTWDTVTEDAVMSYKTSGRQYEKLHAKEYPQALEVPPDILAHVQQKHRWVKGHVQSIRLYALPILMSPDISFSVKLHYATQWYCQIDSSFTIIRLTLLPLLKHVAFFDALRKNSKLMVMVDALAKVWYIRSPWLWYLLYTQLMLTIVVGIMSKTPGPDGHYKTLTSRFLRLRFIPVYLMFTLGMGLFRARATLEGLISGDTTFHTTPKTGSGQKSLNNHWDNVPAVLNLLYALSKTYEMCWVGLYNADENVDSAHDPTIAVISYFWNVCMVAGMVWISTWFLAAKYKIHPAVVVTVYGMVGLAVLAAPVMPLL